jgi:hypothetical protein
MGCGKRSRGRGPGDSPAPDRCPGRADSRRQQWRVEVSRVARLVDLYLMNDYQHLGVVPVHRPVVRRDRMHATWHWGTIIRSLYPCGA